MKRRAGWNLVDRRTREAELGEIPTSLEGRCSWLYSNRPPCAAGARCLCFCSEDEVWCAADSVPARKSSDAAHVVSTCARRNDAESCRDLLDLNAALSSVHDQIEGCVVGEIGAVVVQIQEDHHR